MNGKYIIMPLLLLGISCAKKKSLGELERQLRTDLEKQKGVFAVAFKDLSSGDELLINQEVSFHAASTMKTPVMIEVFKQAQAGKFSLTDSIRIKNEFKSIVDSSLYKLSIDDDSEKELYNRVGEKRLLSDLVYDMIIVSSNLATNLVIELVEAKNVTQSMRDLGVKDIQVLRGVEDNKAYEQGLNNTTTAYDLMIIFEKMANGETVSKEASEKMIHILLDQRFNDIIPARLPENVKVAHKTGSITGVHHDSGIVFLPDGRKYVLVLLSKELENFEEGTRLLAGISEKIYNHLMSQ